MYQSIHMCPAGTTAGAPGLTADESAKRAARASRFGEQAPTAQPVLAPAKLPAAAATDANENEKGGRRKKQRKGGNGNAKKSGVTKPVDVDTAMAGGLAAGR